MTIVYLITITMSIIIYVDVYVLIILLWLIREKYINTKLTIRMRDILNIIKKLFLLIYLLYTQSSSMKSLFLIINIYYCLYCSSLILCILILFDVRYIWWFINLILSLLDSFLRSSSCLYFIKIMFL